MWTRVNHAPRRALRLGEVVEMASLDIDEGFRELFAYRVHEPALECDAAAFERVVRSRRSVRLFDREVEVPAPVVERCLELAMLAPNSSNLQPWEYYWVRSPEKKAALVRLCMSQPPARTASELVVFVARTRTWRRNCDAMYERLSRDPDTPQSALRYYRLVCPLMYTQAWNALSLVKHVILNARALAKPTPREPNFTSGMRMWATKSVSLAASIFMLAISAHGYDSCPMEGCDQSRIKKLLALPADARVVMVIAVGKRAPKGVYGERVRLSPSWFVKQV